MTAGPLVLEATALPTEPQPLPKRLYLKSDAFKIAPGLAHFLKALFFGLKSSSYYS